MERTSELEEIGRAFGEEGRRFVVLRGISGIGKTQLAKAYLSRAGKRAICLKCSSPEVFQQNLYDFLKWDGHLPQEQAFAAQQDYLALFRRVMQEQSSYLVLFDDVYPTEIFDFIGTMPRHGKYLITTSRQNAGPLDAHILPVAPMTDSKAGYILKARNPRLKTCGDPQKTDSLIKDLNTRFGGIPLALMQAAAYMAETGEGLENYLGMVRNLSAQGDGEKNFLRPADNLHMGIWASFSITYRTLQERAETNRDDQTALDVLAWCSVLDPDSISMEFLAGLMGQDASDTNVRARLNAGIERLLSYSLIERDAITSILSIKEIIQDLTLCKLGEETVSSLTAQAGEQLRKKLTVRALLPYNHSEQFPCIKHIQKLVKIPRCRLDIGTAQFLYGNLLESALIRGDFSSAEEYLPQIESMDKGSADKEPAGKTEGRHLISIWCMIAKGFLLEVKGQYNQALELIESLQEETAGWTEKFRAQFPVRYVQWKQLEAYIYNDFLETDPAEKALESAFRQLKTCTDQRGPAEDKKLEIECEKLKMDLINIEGTLASNKEDLRKAAALYQKVLTMGQGLAKQAVGTDVPEDEYENLVKESVSSFPAYVYAYGNLAFIKLHLGGSAEESMKDLTRQGEWLRKMYKDKGSFHPNMAYQQYALGCCLAKLEESTEKPMDCFDSALQILDRAHCSGHPLAPQIHLEMGLLFFLMNSYEKAYRHFDEGLAILQNMRQSRVRLGLETCFLLYKAIILALWKEPSALILWDQLCATRQIPVSQELSVFSKMAPCDIQNFEFFIKNSINNI